MSKFKVEVKHLPPSRKYQVSPRSNHCAGKVRDEMKDIFALAEDEKVKKIERKLSVREQCKRDGYKQKIVGFLWEATYKGYGGETFTHEENLDNFCDYLYGASFQEVLDAYDQFIG